MVKNDAARAAKARNQAARRIRQSEEKRGVAGGANSVGHSLPSQGRVVPPPGQSRVIPSPGLNYGAGPAKFNQLSSIFPESPEGYERAKQSVMTQLIELIRNGSIEGATSLAKARLAPNGACVKPKEYAKLLSAISLKTETSQVLEFFDALSNFLDCKSLQAYKYFYHFSRLVAHEHLAECQSNMERVVRLPSHALVPLGACAPQLMVQNGKGGVELQLSGYLPAEHNFQKGDAVLVTAPHSGQPGGDWSLNADVLNILPSGQGLSVKIIGIRNDQLAKMGIVGSTCRVDKLVNRVTFTRVLEALTTVGSSAGGPLGDLLTASFGDGGTPNAASELDICSELVVSPQSSMGMSMSWSNVNESQNQAVLQGMQRRVSLIQGPPGSGKTHTAVKLVQMWVEAGTTPVLCTADSNIAVDNIVAGCAALGLQLVRIGRPEAIRQDLEQYTLEDMVKKQNAWSGEPLSPHEFSKQQIHILRRAQVVCATCSGAASGVLENITFPCVLIDEAANATEPTTIVPLVRSGVRQAVLVGDHKQLPPTVMCHEAAQAGLALSLFERLVERGVPPVLLDVQYRMHPSIAAFPSKQFYGSALRTGIVGSQRLVPSGFAWPVPSVPIAFVPVEGSEVSEGTSNINHAEAAAVVQVVTELLQYGGLHSEDIGVVSPYAAQVRLLRKQLGGTRLGVAATANWGAGASGTTGVEVGSVDGYQGREKEVLVVSTVRANSSGQVGFLSDPRRLNVTLTRARRGLIVIGHAATLKCDAACWAPWLDWALSCGLVVGSPSTDAAAANALAMTGEMSVEALLGFQA